ncbi:MAG: class I SAM-dependent methyltransferase [Dehalococcoidia bacterium]
MNERHLAYCAGPEWAETVRIHIIPGTTAGLDLGDHLLEVGPGPGLTTDVLRTLVPRLTAVEVDPALAAELAARLTGTNVTVLEADATAMPFEEGHFSAAICLTMLHHVPDRAAQDRLFAEMVRVVRSGGVVIGNDSLDSPEFREFHEGDVCVPIDPDELPSRLEAAGLRDVTVETNPYAYRFVGYAR